MEVYIGNNTYLIWTPDLMAQHDIIFAQIVVIWGSNPTWDNRLFKFLNPHVSSEYHMCNLILLHP